MPAAAPSRAWTELALAANFVEVRLAKQTYSGRAGLNLLEKVQLATLTSLYRAMLAGGDVVLMGAGMPRAISGVLNQFAAGQAAELVINVTRAPIGHGGSPAPLPAPRPPRGPPLSCAPSTSVPPSSPPPRPGKRSTAKPPSRRPPGDASPSPHTRRTTIVAFCPPKPRLLLTTTPSFASRAVFGT